MPTEAYRPRSDRTTARSGPAGVSANAEVKPDEKPEAGGPVEGNAAQPASRPPEADPMKPPSYNEVWKAVHGHLPPLVAVTSLWPARVIVKRTPSGTVYEWPNAGATVMVLAEDVPYLRAKNDRGVRPCCGQSSVRQWFEFP